MGYIRRAVHDRAAVSARRASIVAHLKASAVPLGARDIAAALALTVQDVNNDLNRLLDLGEIIKPETGRWAVAHG